jgi:hypothetical protein
VDQWRGGLRSHEGGGQKLEGARWLSAELSYPIFMPKLSTHRMHDPGSIVSHIRPKVLTGNQMS